MEVHSTAMAEQVIDKLIEKGEIPPEHRAVAVRSLDRELLRRSIRLTRALARMASDQTLLSRVHALVAQG